MMKRFVCAILLAATLLGCLCGCSFLNEVELEPKNGNAMVVIAGRHANARMYTSEMVREHVLSKIDDCTTITKENEKYVADINISIVVSDGDPVESEILYRGEPFSLHFERNDPFNLQEDLADAKIVIEEFLLSEDLRADDPEVDLAAAITEAALILGDKHGEKKHLVIFDTGIVTKGYLDMNKLDIQEGTIDEVLDQLSPGAFPDLEGIDVSFYGIGNIAIGQLDVTGDTVFQDRLVNFWKAYFSRCANENPLTHTLRFSPTKGVEMVHDEESDEGYLKVSNVPFVLSENKLKPEEGDGTGTCVLSDTPIALNSLELSFKEGDWVFEDEAKAKKALRSYVRTFEYLKVKNEKIYIVGSIAKPKPTTNKTSSDVSANRAEAVRNLVVSEYGFDENLIVVLDGGSRVFSWRNAVEFPDGTEKSKDRNAMQANRVVAIIPESMSGPVSELRDAGLIS